MPTFGMELPVPFFAFDAFGPCHTPFLIGIGLGVFIILFLLFGLWTTLNLYRRYTVRNIALGRGTVYQTLEMHSL